VRDTHVRQRFSQAALRLAALGRLQRAEPGIHQRLEIGRLPETPEPSAPAVIADRSLGDPIQPSRQILPIEAVQFSPHHDENFLHQIFEVCIEAAKGARPRRHLVKPRFVHLIEPAEVRSGDWRAPPAFSAARGSATTAARVLTIHPMGRAASQLQSISNRAPNVVASQKAGV